MLPDRESMSTDASPVWTRQVSVVMKVFSTACCRVVSEALTSESQTELSYRPQPVYIILEPDGAQFRG